MINSQCSICKHYQGKLSCEAYPDGIPFELLSMVSHEKPFEGDNGIQFEMFELPEDSHMEKGGEGSGYYKHSGRPGKVGGSAPKGGITPELIQSYSPKEYQSDIAKKTHQLRFGKESTLLPISEDRTFDNLKKLNTNIDNYTSVYSDLFDNKTFSKINTITDFLIRQALNTKDIGIQNLQDTLISAIDNLVYQEQKSWERQLSDHGIRHIYGNITTNLSILNAIKKMGIEVSEKDKFLSTLALVYHDVGYTTNISHTSVAGTRYHKQFSSAIVEDMKASFLEVMDENEFSEMKRWIEKHDDTVLDFESDPIKTSISLSDNLSLFHEEKFPTLFRYIPNSLDLLVNMAVAKKEGKDTDFVAARKDIYKAIDETMLPVSSKLKLKRAAAEVGTYTPDKIIPLLCGKIQNIDYAKEEGIQVTAMRDRFPEKLLGIFDMGQDQFIKFAKDYGLSDEDLANKNRIQIMSKGIPAVTINIKEA